MKNKSTIREIKERFDNDVERFSNLDSGQSSTMDSLYNMDLLAQVGTGLLTDRDLEHTHVLDVGCGAGNYSLKLLQYKAIPAFTLVDLSAPMLSRASERLEAAGVDREKITRFQGDLRDFDFGLEKVDIILAAAVLHHLRGAEEWERVAKSLFDSLKLGGALLVFDLVMDSNEIVNQLSWTQYASYLTSIGGVSYKEKVFAYTDKEDSPATLPFQLDLFRHLGFKSVDVLHKHACFASYAAMK